MGAKESKRCNQCHFLLKTDRKLRDRFKSYAASNGVSMTTAINVLMRSAAKGRIKLVQNFKDTK